jgi:pimeloyl-ACP methyl ester carboxylesterase
MPTQLINGAQIYFERSGEGDEVIVFSHGLLFNHHMWDAQVAHFKNKFCCIAYDHRGQGQSESIGNLDMDTLYEDAAGLIEALSPGKPVHFVGLSMGGFVGMRLAARKSQLLKSLVLLDTSADPEPNKMKYILLNQVFGWGGAKLVSKNVISILFGKSSLEDPSKKSTLERWKNTIESHPKNITKAVAGVIHRTGVYEELSNINIKTLVAVGNEDVATAPAKAKRIHQAISNSQFELISKAGHSACVEQPDSVNQLIFEFIC